MKEDEEVKNEAKIRIAMSELELIAGGKHEWYNLIVAEKLKLQSELIPEVVVRCLN